MAYTVTVHIAPRGTLRRLEDNKLSKRFENLRAA